MAMTPMQAWQILEAATQPTVRLNRADYVAIQEALEVLLRLVEKKDGTDTK